MLSSREFWVAAGERAVRTFAQVLLSTVGVGTTSIVDVDWLGALSIAATATIASLLMSIAGTQSGGGPSLINAEVLSPTGRGYVGEHRGPDAPDPAHLDGRDLS